MRKFCISLCTIGIAAVLVAPVRAEDAVSQILKNGKLRTAYNPVLLDYLVEEGADDLPKKLHKQALDQLVTALKAETTITDAEQRTAALATAAALLAEALGSGLTSELGQAAGDATHSIYAGWIDAADKLLKAGYTADAIQFYEHCMTFFPYADLQGRCALGLARSKPDEAIDLLIKASEASSKGAVNAALWSLGGLAASDALGDAHKTRIIEHIRSFTTGLKKASYGRAACRAMVRTGNEKVIPRLKELKGGMMNTDISPCALRGLLLTFDDRSVVPDLAKKLKGGMFDTTKPAEKLSAARTLMTAGEDAGFEWAARYLTGKKKPKDRQKEIDKALKKGKHAKWKKPDEGDMRSRVVTALVETGGERAAEVLAMGFHFTKQGHWIETWIALGMYKLGDDSQVELLKGALSSREWDFTTLRIAEAFAAEGDTSGVPAIGALYDEAVGRAKKARKDSERADLRRLRSGIANAAAVIDRDDCVPILTRILTDTDASVRTSAAYALARMRKAKVNTALEQALGVDYGKTKSGPRTPIVHAHLTRSAAAREPRVARVLAKATASPLTSVKFLALSANYSQATH